MGIYLKFCPFDQMRPTAFLHQEAAELADRNDKDICVAGFNHNDFVTICCSVFCMQEDLCVCFLVIAVFESFKTYWLIADNTLIL